MQNTIYQAPVGAVDAVLDTDTYNEIDDQFAIAYLLKSGDRIRVKGITVAPFLNNKVASIEEGLDKSDAEVRHLLRLMGREDVLPLVKRGSDRFMTREDELIRSEASDFLVEVSRGYTREAPLYVVAIGAITNVAAAILTDPTITERICVVWLGGAAHGFWHNREFNMRQDYAAARVVMGSAAELIQVPCQGVVTAFCTSEHELAYWLKDKSPLADYLYRNTVRVATKESRYAAWGRVLWDVVAVAWLINDNQRFMRCHVRNRRLPMYDNQGYEPAREDVMGYVEEVYRDALFTDLFTKLTQD